MYTTIPEEAINTVKGYRPITQLLPAHWQEGTVTANGIRQHYIRTGGDRPPLVMLHGIMEGSLSWLRVARALEGEYDLILLDTRGHGLSEGVASGYTSDLLTEDAAGAIRALGLGRTHLLGFSQGGGTALFVADRYPDLIRSLTVSGYADAVGGQADPAALGESEQYQAWLRSWEAWLTGLKTQSHEERMVSSLSQLPPGAPLLPEEEYVPWVEDSARLDPALVRMGRSLWSGIGERGQQMLDALQRVTVPTLIIKSGFYPTPGAPKSVQEEPSERPNVRTARFENTGHHVHREQFDAFIALVREFLAAH